jgi:hypothetical protein
MIDFFLAPENVVFTTAIGIVFALGLLEGLGLLLGLSLVALFDNLSPIDMDFELDANAAEVTTGGLTQLLGWLCLNRLPLMIWLVLLLTCFGIIGYIINFTSMNIFSIVLPAIITMPVALVLGLILTGRMGHKVANVLPQNETSAVSTSSFEGKLAVISSGTARIGSPTQASLVDDFNQKHYIMVEPTEEGQTFTTGDEVILVQKGEQAWQVIGLS